jgi:phosphate transport system permease protein
MAKNPEVTYSSVKDLAVTSDFARLTVKRIRERVIEFLLFLAALSSIAITVGIVGVLLYESQQFFEHVSIIDFVTDTQWTVLFADPHYGIMPLVTGTIPVTRSSRL